MSDCAMFASCDRSADYVLVYEVLDGDWPMCAEHTAFARDNDPLGYIESVRSLRPVGSIEGEHDE